MPILYVFSSVTGEFEEDSSVGEFPHPVNEKAIANIIKDDNIFFIFYLLS